MSHMGKAWIVAESVGAMEHAKNNLRSFSHTKKLSSSSSTMAFGRVREEKAKQLEESLRTVMYLSCWGPTKEEDIYEGFDHPLSDEDSGGRFITWNFV
ncbi:hypothetical protein AAG906_008107 [Vitis piasezkii]